MFKHRAAGYDRLQWAQDCEYMSALVAQCAVNRNSIVCDAGTGTGIVAYELSKKCKRVIAVDCNPEMLAIARAKRQRRNIEYVCKNLSFPLHQIFDCIVARMVLHHAKNDVAVVKNLISHIAPGGRLVVAEGVPPEGAEDFYTRVFKIKEKRRVYTIPRLVRLVGMVSKTNSVGVFVYKQKDMSTLNWLDNSGISDRKKRDIFLLHANASSRVREAYNMRFVGKDIVADWQSAIVVGVR